MPIAPLPASTQSVHLNGVDILLTDVVVPDDGPYSVGWAVAVISTDEGLRFAKCGAEVGDYPFQFVGFLGQTADPGAQAKVITGRGSKVTPTVEGGDDLVPNTSAYLSATPGEVTQTAPAGVGVANLRVGQAISTTVMLLTTDALYQFGG